VVSGGEDAHAFDLLELRERLGQEPSGQRFKIVNTEVYV
jgi:hypothetical protein